MWFTNIRGGFGNYKILINIGFPTIWRIISSIRMYLHLTTRVHLIKVIRDTTSHLRDRMLLSINRGKIIMRIGFGDVGLPFVDSCPSAGSSVEVSR